MWTIFLLIFLTLLLGLGAWFIFLWSVKSGQYDDPEGPKYRMLEDEDEKEINDQQQRSQSNRPSP
jgi:cbb3-type cytochrome oxidase maturation protein